MGPYNTWMSYGRDPQEAQWQPDPLAEAERITRRVAGILVELQRRSAEVDRLRVERDALAVECEELREKASQFDALMATKTLRFLAPARRLYAACRSRIRH